MDDGRKRWDKRKQFLSYEEPMAQQFAGANANHTFHYVFAIDSLGGAAWRGSLGHIMSKKNKTPLFYRSFHLTLGAVTLILPVFIWMMDGPNSNTWPHSAWILLFVLFIGGTCIFLFGALASDKKIESMRIVVTEGNLMMAVLATPLYLVLRGIQRKKRERLLNKKHKHDA